MNIFFVIDRFFPTDHAFLETVYSKVLPSKKDHVFFLFRTNQINDGKIYAVKKWNNSIVFLINTFGKKNIVNNFIVNLKFFFLCFYLKREKSFEIIQVRNWVWGGIVAWMMTLFGKSKFVFQHSFPREILLKEKIEKERLDKKIRAFFELQGLKFVWKVSDAVFSISEEMKRVLTQKGVKENKIYPVGLAFEPDKNYNVEIENQIKNKYGLHKKETVLYFGVMDEKRNLEFLIDVWSLVTEEIDNAILLMVGGTERDVERLKSYSRRIHIDNKIIFVGRVPRNEMKYYIKVANLSVSPIPPIPLYTVSSVTKVYESLGYGCPVVGNDLPEQGKVLRESGGGITVKYEKKDFAKAIIRLLGNKNLEREMGERGKKWVLQNRTYGILAERITEIYKRLVN